METSKDTTSNSVAEPLRYERKFLITDYSYKEVEQLIKYHSACFKEIFHQRQINNIYFDSLGMDSYFDNVEGEQNRTKARIRWYGDLFVEIKKPVLEFKIKKGLLGNKKSYKLAPFVLDTSFSKSSVEQALNNSSIPVYIKNLLLSLKPSLLNSYTRKYFLSADNKFRITIDTNLTYYKIACTGNTFLNKSQDFKSTVLELKYDSKDELEAKEVGATLPFMMTKNSKYIHGIERVLL